VLKVDSHGVSVAFDAHVGRDGTIRLPARVLERFPAGGATKVRVRLTGQRQASALARHGVTEEEIERIAALQMESRDRVVRFLLAGGSLSGQKAFLRRSREMRR